MRRAKLIRNALGGKNIKCNWHDPETGLIEAVLARGDRKLCPVIEKVWRFGARLEAWSDFFSFKRWTDAFDACGVDPLFYAQRNRGYGEVLPWSMISTGVNAEFLVNERELCSIGKLTENCGIKCAGCGACSPAGGGSRSG